MVRGRNWWLLIACCLLLPWAARAAEPAADSAAKSAVPAPAAPSSDEATKPDSAGVEKGAADRKADDEYFELYKALADTIDQVERNYVKPVDRRELMEAAIKGIVSKLDPYSSYIGPDEFGNFRDAVESQFGGIGIQVTVDDGQLKVISPLVGTPAYRAGVQAGDKIVKIDDQPTENITLDEATKRLKGELGTSINLTVQHADHGKTETFSIKRELIHVGTVLGNSRRPDDTWDYMLDPERRIGYIRVTAFSRDTATDLRKALEDLKARKMRALILDLRFNPGGLLSSAVEVSNMFISKGRIVSVKGRSTPERVWDAVKGESFEGFPMVVLVNHYSASASEIVAACLQDNDRAAVVGDRTWGKGSVQNVVELESGKSALKLTTSSYTRPNGHKIHRFPEDKETDEWGVKPDKSLEVKLSTTEMAEMLNYRRERDVVEGKHHDEKQQAGTKNAETASSQSKGSDAKAGASQSAKQKIADSNGKSAQEKNSTTASAQSAKVRRPPVG